MVVCEVRTVDFIEILHRFYSKSAGVGFNHLVEAADRSGVQGIPTVGHELKCLDGRDGI